jgi:hypothetical protein
VEAFEILIFKLLDHPLDSHLMRIPGPDWRRKLIAVQEI